jgi:4-amino-4-deoxy-L-arabinose transferase-like glycosyltransferase
MGSLTVLLVYGIARRFHNRRKSLLASAIAALYPLQVFATGVHYPVALQTLLVAGIIWLLLGAILQTSRRNAFFAGLLGGAAALTAPSILPALCLAALWLLWEGRGRWRLHLPVLFAVPIMLVVGTWTVRNYQCFHRLVPVSLNAGYDFWLGNFPGTKAATGNRPIPGRDREKCALRAAYPGEAELDRAYFRKGMEHVRADPRRFAVLTACKALYLWHVYPDPMTESVSTKRKLACLFTYGLLLPFGLYWLLRNVTRSPGARLVLLFFLSYTLVHAVSLSKVRFRLPLDTLLIVMAVGGLGDLARRLGCRLLEE